jgi:hypothetical protein
MNKNCYFASIERCFFQYSCKRIWSQIFTLYLERIVFQVIFKKIVLYLAMTNWLIHRLLTAKHHISDIPAILCRMTKWKLLLRRGILLPIYMVMFWQSGQWTLLLSFSTLKWYFLYFFSFNFCLVFPQEILSLK